MQKSLGSTEDELQAAALLISLKDSSSPGAAAPSTQKTEHDAPQVSWAAFSGTPVTIVGVFLASMCSRN